MAGAGEGERMVQKSYWIEHSKDLTVEAMMLDSRASNLDKEERPEVILLSLCHAIREISQAVLWIILLSIFKIGVMEVI